MPFSFARERQSSDKSRRVSSKLESASGDNEEPARFALPTDTGVVTVELFDDQEDRKLRGVKGVERVLAGVSGERK